MAEDRGSERALHVVVVAFDATREHTEHELRKIIDGIRLRGDILGAGDTLLVLGVLHTVPNPMGYQTKACTNSFGGTNSRALEEEVKRKIEIYERMILRSAWKCKEGGVARLNVKIAAGTPTKIVILQEVISCKATWLILDRHLRRDMKFYLKHIPCKVALIQDSLFVELLKKYVTNTTSKGFSEQRSFYAIERSIQPLQNSDLNESAKIKQPIVSYNSFYPSSSSHDCSEALKYGIVSSSSFRSQNHNALAIDGAIFHQSSLIRGTSVPEVLSSQDNAVSQYDFLERPILCAICGLASMLYVKESMKFPFLEIQSATSDFSKDYLLGEGGFGHVYKGQLKDGQMIAAKLRKEASTQGYTEFFSEVHVLSFARHRNIVMLLGYCCKENYNILVYEYICNKSLDWHLFSESANVLEWHKRHAIAVGIAKGLRFLHEECRAGPIIHRDLRPSNILLTHDFVPMIGDFGLAKWKSNDDSFQTRILGTSGYLAPEYAEYGIVSVRTDVYAYGIVLFQLISGRKVVDDKGGHYQHILHWAEPHIMSGALHELVDPRLGDSYDIFELYRLVKVAHLCIKRSTEIRPSMGEVVRVFEESDRVRDLQQQFSPHFMK